MNVNVQIYYPPCVGCKIPFYGKYYVVIVIILFDPEIKFCAVIVTVRGVSV
jgi:hypothetical protein